MWKRKPGDRFVPSTPVVLPSLPSRIRRGIWCLVGVIIRKASVDGNRSRNEANLLRFAKGGGEPPPPPLPPPPRPIPESEEDNLEWA